jgi:hypothetical protein
VAGTGTIAGVENSFFGRRYRPHNGDRNPNNATIRVIVVINALADRNVGGVLGKIALDDRRGSNARAYGRCAGLHSAVARAWHLAQKRQGGENNRT